MTDMPRFKWTSFGPMLDEDGPFVLLVDAEAAIEQGQRDVFATHLEWTVTGMCKPDCLPCQRLNELVNEREAGYSEGKRDAIAAAVQRVEALHERYLFGKREYAALIAAINTPREN